MSNAPRGLGLKASYALGAYLRGRVSGARVALSSGRTGDASCVGITCRPFWALRFQRLLHRSYAPLRAMQETLSRLRHDPSRP